MRVDEDDRRVLDENTDFDCITQHIQSCAGTKFPPDALVLDEDVPKTPVLKRLRAKSLTYKNGRPGLAKYNRIQVIHASNIFKRTVDEPLLRWCKKHQYHLLTCNYIDFKKLDKYRSHWGILAVLNQSVAHNTPKKLARKLDLIFNNNNKSSFQNKLFGIK